MKVHRADDNYMTERQWALKGYLKKDNVTGVLMWTNRNCQKSAVYLTSDEVRLADDEEIIRYFKPEKDRKAIQARQKKEHERNYISELEEKTFELKEKVSELEKKLYKAEQKISLLKCSPSEILIVDTETTGRSYFDELLQVSIIDMNKEIRYNSYIRPSLRTSWESAEQVNHISPDMVKNAPSITNEIPKINAVLSSAKVLVGYNISFDLSFLTKSGVRYSFNTKIYDVMKEFAEIYGDWSEHFSEHKRQKLSACAEYYGYDWSNGKAHNSLSDCYATLHCFEKMLNEE